MFRPTRPKRACNLYPAGHYVEVWPYTDFCVNSSVGAGLRPAPTELHNFRQTARGIHTRCGDGVVMATLDPDSWPNPEGESRRRTVAVVPIIVAVIMALGGIMAAVITAKAGETKGRQ